MRSVLEFKDEFEAWEWIKNNYPGISWYLDTKSSERAGYRTYRDTKEFYNYVCDLGTRLELNLKEGNQTINVWYDVNKEEREVTEKSYNIEFTESQLILIKGALSRLSTSFNELDVVSGDYKNVRASINCLEMIKMIKDITDEKN